ncbi:hypothetical protein GCM10007874_35710 [Labrys miyagiensis]|uniref:Uncharacterized protein n=1 Tax=Labrys miyagiensis TaxID=346912 RepID=A0ABQ6CLA7_9HYPH|nr:hypothetical protein GCM10007874_35710 [Labrys miyagiensis]
MDSKPDHGEESYRGSGKLAGRKALVTGAILVSAAPSLLPSLVKARTSRFLNLPNEEADAAEVIELVKAEGGKAGALPGDIEEGTLVPGHGRKSR